MRFYKEKENALQPNIWANNNSHYYYYKQSDYWNEKTLCMKGNVKCGTNKVNIHVTSHTYNLNVNTPPPQKKGSNSYFGEQNVLNIL